MKFASKLRTALFMTALAAVLVGFSGCTTNESENLSSRPWNTPKSWEHGLPGMINEGR